MFRIRQRWMEPRKIHLLFFITVVFTIFTMQNDIHKSSLKNTLKANITTANLLKTNHDSPSLLQYTISTIRNPIPRDKTNYESPESLTRSWMQNNSNNLINNNTKPNVNPLKQQNDYKIEMEVDTGSDFQYSSVEYSLSLIKEGLEKLHGKALQYLGLQGLSTQAPSIKKNISETILENMQLYEQIWPFQKLENETVTLTQSAEGNAVNSINTKEGKVNEISSNISSAASKSSSEKQYELCNTEIKLDSCQCTRRLKSRLKKCPTTNTDYTKVLKMINETSGESTCNNWATMRGQDQKVVSFSLFGRYPNDYHGNTENVIKQVQSMYPGWIIRIYHHLSYDRTEQRDWLCSIACNYSNVDFCQINNISGGIGNLNRTIGTVWRMSVMGDPLVKQFMIRDLDSPILQREVSAVNEWIELKKCFHVMRDNPAHNVPIMAGMWGGCNAFHPEAMPRLRDLVFKWSKKPKAHSKDQVNISILLWPFIRKNCTAHDAYSCLDNPGSRPFPTQRINSTFIGMRSARKKYVEDRIFKPCPMACRPPKHKDWAYC